MTPPAAPEHDLHARYLRKVIACFLIALAAWGAADVVMTATSTVSPVMVINEEFVEGLGRVMRRGFQYDVTYVNSLGLRREELPAVVPGERRILVLGDSVTFGSGVAQGEDWPAMLEKYLRSRGVAVTVMNAGEPGKKTGFMLAALKYYLHRIKVDAVLVQNSGNMLALGAGDPALAHDPRDVLERLFPDYRDGSLKTSASCPEASVGGDEGRDSVSLPAIVKRLSPYSPSINGVALWLSGPDRPHNNLPRPVSSSCIAPPAGNYYLVREALAMAQIAEYARRERIPLAFVRPTYVFSWAGAARSARSTLPAAYRDGYQGSWALVENVDGVFDFFAGSGVVRLLDPVAMLRVRHPVRNADLAKLYSDHTHYTAEGSRFIAQAIGDELLAAATVVPVSSPPWTHPAQRVSPDLVYPGIPASLGPWQLACAALLVSLATFAAGLVLQALVFRGALPVAASPMLGFCVIFAAARLADNFALDESSWVVGLACLAAVGAALIVTRRRGALGGAGLLVSASAALAVASTGLILLFLHLPAGKDQRHVHDIQAEIAWADYLVPDSGKRALQFDLYRRWHEDNLTRPFSIPNVVTTHPRVVEPASPAVAAGVSRATGLPAADSVIGTSAAFSSALAMFAFMAAWSLRGHRVVAGVVGAAGLCAFVVSTLWLPSPLTMSLAAALALVHVALARGHDMSTPARFALLAVAGMMLYALPATAFLAFLAALVSLAVLASFRRSGRVREALFAGAFVLVALLSARAALFSLPVVDPRLTLLLGANYINISPFFL